MRTKFIKIVLLLSLLVTQRIFALSSGDVNVRLISGYFWLDNSCTAGGPLGKVVSYRVKNTKGSLLQGVSITMGTISFTATGGTSYSSGTPSFVCRTSPTVYLGNIAAGDSVTAFFFVGYNCLMYPNNTNITTDYITLPVTLKDVNSGTVSTSFNMTIYVIRNANNNTITVLATTPNLVGTMLTISVAYTISNVKPTNIIDMELSTTSNFPAGYSIIGCKITASTITADFPVNMLNTHYSNSITSNLPSGGTVTIEWYLKITGASTGITFSNLVPFVVSDAGSAQRWQANTTSFTGTSTPTNSLSISKRVNHNTALTNDTVVYTIVLKNSSALYDISIDQLVDNLPRDYKFLHMETNLGVFPRLVTYSNSTVYPVYEDTNYLNFYGQKEISSGVFSYVVPKSDSVKLIYSTRVSQYTGINDTNFITAYVGSSAVGTAFAVVSIYSPLPLGVVRFNADKCMLGARLVWTVANETRFSNFDIYRQEAGSEDFVQIGKIDLQEGQNGYDFSFTDASVNTLNAGLVVYRLNPVSPDVKADPLYASLDLGIRKDFGVIGAGNDYYSITGIPQGVKSVRVSIHDVCGRALYTGTIERNSDAFMIPYSFSNIKGTCIMLTVEAGTGISTRKLLME